MLIIGSKALVHWGLLDKTYSPKDLDVIGTSNELHEFLRDNKIISFEYTSKDKCFFRTKKYGMVDFEIAENNTGSLLLEFLGVVEHSIVYAPVDVLYMLKKSHRFRKNSPHFYKTLEHINLFRDNGVEIPPELENWYKLRVHETYDYKHPNLNQSKDEFFSRDDGVPYIYDHDDIHEAVKILDKPAYTFFSPEDKEVFCSKDMFMACDENVKILSVVEESMVLTLERSLIPRKFKPNPNKMFRYALMKVCTSITSGWWRSFAYDNHDKALAIFESLPPTYMQDKFKEFKAKGLIRAYNPNSES